MRKLLPSFLLTLLIALFLFLQKAFWCSPVCFNKSEGTYWQTIRQLKAGYHLYSQIYYSQFPLFIEIAALGGRLNPAQDLCGARLLLCLISATALIAIYFLASRLAGRLAGLIAALLLAAEPLYFHLSHQLTGETAALALCLWGFYFLLRSRERMTWVWTSALFFSAAIQMKPLALVPFAVAVLMLIKWAAKRLEFSRVAFFVSLALVLNVSALAAAGWFDSAVGLTQLQGGYFARFLRLLTFDGSFPPVENISRVLAFRDYSRAALLFDLPCLAAVAALLWRTPRQPLARGLAVVACLFAAVLLLYVKVNTDHLVLFAPLSACAIGAAVSFRPRARYAWVVFAIFVSGALWIDIGESRDLSPRWARATARALTAVSALAPREAQVLGDDSFLITSCGRLTPPEFTDFSHARLETGSITCESLREAVKSPAIGGFLMSQDLIDDLPCPSGLTLRGLVEAQFPNQVYRDKHYSFYTRLPVQRD